MSDLDYFLILNLQEGFAEVVMMYVQRGLDKELGEGRKI